MSDSSLTGTKARLAETRTVDELVERINRARISLRVTEVTENDIRRLRETVPPSPPQAKFPLLSIRWRRATTDRSWTLELHRLAVLDMVPGAVRHMSSWADIEIPAWTGHAPVLEWCWLDLLAHPLPQFGSKARGLARREGFPLGKEPDRGDAKRWPAEEILAAWWLYRLKLQDIAGDIYALHLPGLLAPDHKRRMKPMALWAGTQLGPGWTDDTSHTWTIPEVIR